ncbi:MAG: sugar ABC transporter permease [Anaerolineae bacterium]|nr:sugar ABC transporter permease [Anaerolineae bacterium]
MSTHSTNLNEPQPQTPLVSLRTRRRIGTALRYGLAMILIIFAVLPVLWVISASLNPAKSLVGGTIWPKNPGFTNYDQLLNNEFFPYVQWLINSAKLATISAVGVVLVSCFTGYALSRFRFRGREHLMTGLLIVNVFPAVLGMVALFSMLQQLGLVIPILGLDTHGGLAMIYIGGGLGLNVLMVKSFIDSIPLEIDESALVEGATFWQTFWYIIFPMIRPIIITVGVLTFMAAYGDFVIARVLLKSMDKLTVMVGLMLFRSDRFDQDFGMITAGAIMAAIPVILLYIPLQKYVISGMTSGAVKG